DSEAAGGVESRAPLQIRPGIRLNNLATPLAPRTPELAEIWLTNLGSKIGVHTFRERWNMCRSPTTECDTSRPGPKFVNGNIVPFSTTVLLPTTECCSMEVPRVMTAPAQTFTQRPMKTG